MRRLSAVAVVFVALVAAACGGDTRDSLAREAQNTMAEFATTMDSIKDVDSARAAKPKLQSLIAKLEDINKRGEKLPEPTEAESKAMMEKYSKEMESTMMKMQGAFMRIAMDPAIQAELKDLDFEKVGGR
jgi:hypothetical protein